MNKVHGSSIVFNAEKKGNEKSFYTWCGLRTRGKGSVDSSLYMPAVDCRNCLRTWKKVYVNS